MPLRVEERIVDEGRGEDFIVHHLVLRGPNRAIGRHLGSVARARYGVAAPAAGDPLRVRVQREWLRRNAPISFERMRGAAEALGIDLADDACDVSRLGAPPQLAGCSAAFLPPRRTTHGRPLVSRAFDFAGPLAAPRAGEAPAASRPYVLELHPDEGYPTLALCAFDLLGGAVDGVNAEGLVVVAVTDLEAADAGPFEPAGADVGLDELQLVRHLLDTCATAIEARETLLAAKHYYAALPVHLLVADRHGDAFVFEPSRGRNRVHLVEAAGAPIVVANHALHRHPDPAALPAEPGPGGTFARWRALAASVAGAGRLDASGLAAAAARGFPGRADRPLRTLWHGIYDPVERSLSARFLPEEPAAAGGALPLRFELAA